MGELFFGIDIQKEVADAFPTTDTTSMILVKYTNGTPTPGRTAGGTNATPTNYPCHGVVTEYDNDELLADKDVLATDKKVVIIGKDLADAGVKPESQDMILVGTEQYTVVNARAGGYQAAWFAQCRGE